jgi:hypothetical protein
MHVMNMVRSVSHTIADTVTEITESISTKHTYCTCDVRGHLYMPQ